MEMLFELFVAIMAVNLKTLILKPFVMIWVSNISFLLPMCLVRMVQLRGRIIPFVSLMSIGLQGDIGWNTACHVGNRIFLRAFLNNMCYELMHGRAPSVSHFRAFGCRCFILKKARLDKFESTSSDGIFLGYASHSRAFCVLNLDTNLVMETCDVTFDKTQPFNSFVFECAGDDEVGKKIFEDKEDDAGEDDGDDGEAPAMHVPSTSTTMTTVQDGPSPTPPTIPQDQVEVAAEGEVVSRREAPRCIQVDHRPSRIISDINERMTQSRSRNASHFAHSAFVATFELKALDTLYLIQIG
jgi:hypothetical protein